MTNLTEYSWYYCKMNDGDIRMLERGADYFLDGDVPLLNNEVKSVLAEVPSYEQWIMTKNLSERAHLEMYKARGEKVKLEKENTKLKELLKESRFLLGKTPYGNMSQYLTFTDVMKRIDEVLGEE